MINDTKIRALIVDDEERGRHTLRNLLNEYCTQVEVVALADSVIGKYRQHSICSDFYNFL